MVSTHCYLCFDKIQVETAHPLAKLCLEFPDLYIGKSLFSSVGFLENMFIFFYLILIMISRCNIKGVTAKPDTGL